MSEDEPTRISNGWDVEGEKKESGMTSKFWFEQLRGDGDIIPEMVKTGRTVWEGDRTQGSTVDAVLNAC